MTKPNVHIPLHFDKDGKPTCIGCTFHYTIDDVDYLTPNHYCMYLNREIPQYPLTVPQDCPTHPVGSHRTPTSTLLIALGAHLITRPATCYPIPRSRTYHDPDAWAYSFPDFDDLDDLGADNPYGQDYLLDCGDRD